jgi:hypothetical protein
MGQSGAWFAQPEAQLTEHPLALANPDGNSVPLLNPGTECFSIPEVPAQTNLPRRIAQNLIHRRPLFFRQASGSPLSLPLRQCPCDKCFAEKLQRGAALFTFSE